MKLLKVVELNKDGNTDKPVDCVCYHPLAVKRLKNGEDVTPMYCAVEVEDGEQELINICKENDYNFIIEYSSKGWSVSVAQIEGFIYEGGWSKTRASAIEKAIAKLEQRKDGK